MVVPHCGLGPAVAGHSRLHGLRHILRHLVRRRNVQEMDLLHARLLLHVRLCHPTHQGTVMIILFCLCLCRALPFSLTALDTVSMPSLFLNQGLYSPLIFWESLGKQLDAFFKTGKLRKMAFWAMVLKMLGTYDNGQGTFRRKSEGQISM